MDPREEDKHTLHSSSEKRCSFFCERLLRKRETHEFDPEVSPSKDPTVLKKGNTFRDIQTNLNVTCSNPYFICLRRQIFYNPRTRHQSSPEPFAKSKLQFCFSLAIPFSQFLFQTPDTSAPCTLDVLPSFLHFVLALHQHLRKYAPWERFRFVLIFLFKCPFCIGRSFMGTLTICSPKISWKLLMNQCVYSHSMFSILDIRFVFSFKYGMTFGEQHEKDVAKGTHCRLNHHLTRFICSYASLPFTDCLPRLAEFPIRHGFPVFPNTMCLERCQPQSLK